MSHHLHHPETIKWVVAHNGSDIFHYSVVEPHLCFTTGQPYMEVFNSQEELLSAFPQLSGNFIEPELELELPPEPEIELPLEPELPPEPELT